MGKTNQFDAILPEFEGIAARALDWLGFVPAERCIAHVRGRYPHTRCFPAQSWVGARLGLLFL